MARNHNDKTSIKHLQVDKTQTKTALTVAGLVFVIIFSLIVARSLWAQRSFQTRVIKEKEAAVRQLNENVEAAKDLEISYRAFANITPNAIGGSRDGSGERDGDNARLILDALPSQYDYPALISSVEKILEDNNYDIESISGRDELVELGDGDKVEAIQMPFEFRVNTTPSGMLDLMRILRRSIRPLHITEIGMTASSSGGLELRVKAFSYFQPEVKLDITTKEIR